MKHLAFFLNFEPNPPTITHQNGIKARVINGHIQFYKSQALRELEAKYISRLKRFAPNEPWSCPICLMTRWIFCKPKSAKGIFKTTKPDTDNLVKTLKDCMTKCGFWKDDALSCREVLEKVWLAPGEKHGILISITELSNQGEKQWIN